MSSDADVAALKLARDCWRVRLGSGGRAAQDLLGQIDAILDFLPLAPEPLHALLTDRAWCLLAAAVQSSPRAIAPHCHTLGLLF